MSRFKINDRVVVHNKKGEEIAGVVRWVGTKTRQIDLGSVHVGIEMDTKVFGNDVRGCRTGLAYVFKAKSGHHLVMPERCVEKAAAGAIPPENTPVDLRNIQFVAVGNQPEVQPQTSWPLSCYAPVPQPDTGPEYTRGVSVGGGAERSREVKTQGRGNQNRYEQFQQQQGQTRYRDQQPLTYQDRGELLDQSNFQGTQQQAEIRPQYYTNVPLTTLQPSNDHQQQAAAQAQPISYHGHCATLPAKSSLEIGSLVQISNHPSLSPFYGVIRWIGTVPTLQGLVAGVELEEYMDGCSDGTLQSTGQKLFQCPPGCGLYYRLAKLKPDQRFSVFFGATGGESSQGNPLQGSIEEQVDQQIHTNQMKKYIGDKKGIQGHKNSSYLDSTLFGLFALSDVFDTMFLEANMTPDQETQRVISDLLWKVIVNPLRKDGVVRYESVMKLRNKLEELELMEGITEKEKDPESILNMLFKSVLRTTPFISVRRPFGIEQEFFVQLIAEYDENLRLPTVGDLLTKMFTEQNISFTKVPSRLLIQVPRFGRGFKTFQKIVPDLKLCITDLTDRYNCYMCGQKAVLKCEGCVDTYFCQRCSDTFHQNHLYEERRTHTLVDAFNVGDVSELDLLSVICIETSHYVCFTRDPRDDQENKWIFFDSMAERHSNKYNIPKVTDCTRDLNEWVYPANGDRTRLMSTEPRQLPELVRRFTQDVYMCVYIQPDVAMYGDDDEDFGECSTLATMSVQSSPRGIPQGYVKKDDLDVVKEENARLLAEKAQNQERLENDISALKREIDEIASEKHTVELQKFQLQNELGQVQTDSQEQLTTKEQEIEQSQRQIQQLENANQWLHAQFTCQQDEIQFLQKKIDNQVTESGFAKVRIPHQSQESWNVHRRDVQIHDELGSGAWGSVCKGSYRGRAVAVKRAHKAILHKNTIDQLKREIRIMVHVQHPNLVRLIAAVVDRNVEQRLDSPLLVLELLDTNLRTAYEKKDLRKNTLLSIFRDVAYALHYLHEHQEPIIHRDVSAPNVLLEEVHPGVWRAKLSDFGSANVAIQCKTAGAGAIVYSAPETFPPRNPDDPLPIQTTKIDVFSYGYLLTEVIAKEMPSAEKRKEMLETVERQWKPMFGLTKACIRYEPEERPTITQVLENLNTIAHQ